MTSAHVLEACNIRGLALSLEGDSLRVRGPSGAREELLPAIREHKAEIVALLRKEQSAPTPHRWARGPFGEQVDLFGLNRFEDPNRDSPFPRGSQCN